MAIKNIEIQDDAGNIYYPHTSAKVVQFADGKNLEDKLTATMTYIDQKSGGGSKGCTEFGLEDTVNVGASIFDKKAILVADKTSYKVLPTMNGVSSTTVRAGIYFKPVYDSYRVRVSVRPMVTATTAYILDVDAGNIFKMIDVTGQQLFDVDYFFKAGSTYAIFFDSKGSNYNLYYDSATTYPLSCEGLIITAGYYDGKPNTTACYAISALYAMYNQPTLEGTITKVYSPTCVTKWKEFSWLQDVPANTSVTCNIADAGYDEVISSNSVDPATVLLNTSSYGKIGIKFNSKYAMRSGKISVEASLQKTGAPSGDLSVELYECNATALGTLVGQGVIKASTITTSKAKISTIVDLVAPIKKGSDYVLLYSHPANATNYYSLACKEDSAGSNGVYFGTSILAQTKVVPHNIIPVAEILKTSSTGVIDLSDVDPLKHPAIKAMWRLNRTSISVNSPIIASPALTFEGTNAEEWIPKIPMVLDESISVPSGQTATLFSIDNAKGAINRLSLQSGSMASFRNLIVWIDGEPCYLASKFPDDAVARSFARVNGGGSLVRSSDLFDYMSPIYFKSSLKITIYNTSSSAQYTKLVLDYALM